MRRGEVLGLGGPEGRGARQADDGEIAAGLQLRVEKVPGRKPIFRPGLEQIDREVSEWSRGSNHPRTGGDHPGFLSRADLQFLEMMTLEPPRRPLDRLDSIHLDIELDVLAQLQNIETVPLEIGDDLAAGGGDQIGITDA